MITVVGFMNNGPVMSRTVTIAQFFNSWKLYSVKLLKARQEYPLIVKERGRTFTVWTLPNS